ncbi:MAG: aminotransferase class I/II-fold pyridoxal phosphate-dependent enzyme [Candidatus Aminicenantes bacterium]|nr:aminotransferase class I/II-fold pyridoxal phosphate-dependent enzyme [Candidatus Aminicenantes bacterium]
MDIFEKCYQFTRSDEAIAAGLYPYFNPIREVKGNKVITADGRELIMVGSNNYLGLVGHPRILQAMKEAIDRYGSSTCGSRFLNGTLTIHEELEEALARFMEMEAALVFSTGYQTNLGIISALVGRKDYVVLDNMDHASIIDAARLSFGKTVKFKHNNPDDLERVLKNIPEDAGKLVVVDGVYSMEGDLADLPRLVPIAKKYGARFMVDDAHGMGVFGEGGRGVVEHFDMMEEVDLVMATFSKSFASLGGFVAGKKKVINYIKHFARSLIFSASITPAQVAAARAALDLIINEPERRHRLWEISKFMKKSFEEMGFDTGKTESPIIPLLIGTEEQLFMMWKMLREEGIFANPVLPPAVPPDKTLIRTSYTATMTDEELQKVLDAFYKAGKAVGVI